MKKISNKNLLLLPIAVWMIVVPIITKVKIFSNPLMEYSWYSNEEYLADIFLYYKETCVVLIGIIMLLFLIWQISQTKKRNLLFQTDYKIFIPLAVYLMLILLSSACSKYRYFCAHGMPEQFESVWVWIAYLTAFVYCYYMVRFQDCEQPLLGCLYVGAALVGLICVLQFFKIDIFRFIYGCEGYSFTFEEGTVYGSFYNTNYVGYYTLLLSPLFIMVMLFVKNWITRMLSAILAIALLIAMAGARSITAVIVYAVVFVFAIMFLILKRANTDRRWYLTLVAMVLLIIFAGIVASPKVRSYIHSCDTEKHDLENIYTQDDCVEVDYKGQQLYISMSQIDGGFTFEITDQNQTQINLQYMESDTGYYYYRFMDDRFAELTIAPALITQDPDLYGFALFLEDKNWCFTNQMTADDTYYYYTDTKKLTKLTADTASDDFLPLVDQSGLASGRGYIWNKTIALLKDYILLGSGADTFALVFPNDDVIDRYNNGYGSMIITKPHSLYLQMAVQSGMLSLICFLVFYGWYFLSSLRLYIREKLDSPLAMAGFAIMLGTMGYMLSGLLNDSTITVAPLYWALMGMGIGINHKLRLN